MDVDISEIHCCECHALFCITEYAENRYRKNHKIFYCPYCANPQHFGGKTIEEKKIETLERANAGHVKSNNYLGDQLNYERKQARAHKGVSTRRKNELEKLKEI